MHFLKLEPRILLANLAPYVVNPIPDQHVTQGDPVTINVAGTFKDPDGDPLKYWSIHSMGQRPEWLTLDQTSGVFSGSTSGISTGVYPVTVSATDPCYKGAATTFRIYVDPNLPPRINKSPANQTAFEDSPFSYQIPADTFVDPEGKPLKYWSIKSMGQMPAWMSFDQTSRTFSGTPAQSDVGVATITVSATDPSYKGAATTFKVTVQNTNDPPVLAAAIPSQSVDQRQTFRYTIPAGTFSDPDGDPLSLSLSGSAPSWLSLSGNIVSGTPTSEADCRNWNIGVRAADPSGSIAEAVFLLTVNNVNDPPIVAKPIPDQSAEQGHEFQFTVPAETFTDPEGKSLTYWSFQNKGQMPAWMSFDQGSRTFSGTPSQSDVGIHKVTVSATDPSYKGIATTFKITVKDVPENKPPEIIDIPDTIFWLPGSRPAAISGTSLIISDPDSPDFNGGFLEIKLNNALDGDYIYCPNISSGIGDLTRYNNTHFRIDLKEMSYPVEINKLMYNITYSNTLNEPPPGVRDLIVILNDGDGGETIV